MRTRYKALSQMSISSFDGVVPEVPGISVDNFESLNKRAYFLTHCHRDHTQGLTSQQLQKYLEESDVFIYMSELSAAIVEATNDFVCIKSHVKILKLGVKQLIKLPATDHHRELYIEVITIPAGHCFGSVMFLFQTPTKTVLFTGDFRLSVNDVSKLGHLHTKEGDPMTIDKMYVDTTFLNENYEEFPKRSDSVDSAVYEIKKFMETSSDNNVALHTSARFGYEYVFNELFKQLNMKVYVNESDWALYRSYKDLVPGVTNDYTSTRIHKCWNRNEKYAHKCLPFDSSTKKFLYVHFSAMKWDQFGVEDLTYQKSNNRIDVCFPTHCSKNEVIYFISYFAAKEVKGFPNEYVADCNCNNKKPVGFKFAKKKFGLRRCNGKGSIN
ncbi:hypothetical protein ACJJTC_002244 [Scirpophaga incertulas]